MPDGPRASILSTLGWGAYLACSWTWCIGMFLPVLMIRDFGWWSFPVFAIPNCLGAAAMGFVLRKPGSSEAVVAAHGKAIRAFSFLTVVFQLFFLSRLSVAAGPSMPTIANSDLITTRVGIVLGVLFGFLACGGGTRRAIGAILTLATSLGCVVWFATTPGTTPVFAPWPNDFAGLAFLAPVCVFGFALSPFLDATFHKAAGNTPGPVPARFGIGFLAFFPLMIGFTLLYATSMFLTASPGVFGTAVPHLAAMPVLGHIAGQLAFTVVVHGFGDGVATFMKQRLLARLLLCALYAAVLIGFSRVSKTPERFETIYRLFMSFYGLVFPAYVWICMLPTLRAPAKPTRPQLLACALAIALAAPFYWLGFIELKYWALAPGVMIPLIVGLVARRMVRMAHRPERGGAAAPGPQ